MLSNLSLSQNKYDDIKNVCPNFTQNRYDLLFRDNFEILVIEYEKQIYYVPFHIEFITCKVGLWLTEIPKNVIQEIISFIFKKYKTIFVIKIISCPTKYGNNCYQDIDYWINLPQNENEYMSSLSKSTKYNLNRHTKKLRNEVGEYKIVKYDTKNIPIKFINEYFKFKKATIGKSYFLSAKTYLKKYYVTSIYVLSVLNNTAAIVLVSETDNNVYLENVTYNPIFKKYSVGVTLCVYTICDMIRQGRKQFFFGSSNNDDYKRRLCKQSMPTYSMKIYRPIFMTKF